MQFKIQLSVGQKLFFTSDSHFGHKNIVRGVTEWDVKRAENSVRDFDTISEMNETIVKGINRLVRQDDILIHLGDWSFGGFDNIKIFRDRLVCKNIYLVLGNHDHHIENNKEYIRDYEWGNNLEGIKNIFTGVFDGNPNLEVKIPQYEKFPGKIYNFVLSHYPIASWKDMSKGVIHLFGHVHLKPKHALREGKALDVGMDGNNFEPWSLHDIISIMNKQPIASLSLPKDHHVTDVKK